MLAVTTIGSPGSVLSFCGIAYLLFLLFCYFIVPKQGFRRFSVYMTIVCLALIGMLWVGLSKPNITTGPIDDGSAGYYPYVLYECEWRNEQDLYQNGEWGPAAVDLYWEDPRIYKMHVDGGVSDKFYHPDSFWWSPVIAIGIITCLNPSYILLWVGLFLAGNALGNDDC